ncbi:MAG: hypothetical protein ABL927_12075, partial [Bdellovibrionales bacterium]
MGYFILKKLSQWVIKIQQCADRCHMDINQFSKAQITAAGTHYIVPEAELQTLLTSQAAQQGDH